MKKISVVVLCILLIDVIIGQTFTPGNAYSILNRNRVQTINAAEGLAAVATASSDLVSVTVDSDGSILYVEVIGCRLRRIQTDGRVFTVSGLANQCALSPDGAIALGSRLLIPTVVVIDPIDGAIVLAETNNAQVIRKIDKVTGRFVRLAGTSSRPCQFFGDGGNALNAGFCVIGEIAYDDAGNMFITDVLHNRIRRVDRVTNIITTVVGNGAFGFNGENTNVFNTALQHPNSIAFNSLKQMFISSTEGHRILRVLGTVSTYAGNGAGVFSGASVPRTSSIARPSKVAFATNDDLFFYEMNLFSFPNGNLRIRKVDNTTGLMTTVIGGGSVSGPADNIPATDLALVGVDENIEFFNFFIENSGDILFTDRASMWRAIAVAAPQPVCGNGILENGEDCDSANECCGADCKFLPSTFVCRGLNGPCDAEEKCSGTSDLCPSDSFAPSTQFCGQPFGVCEVGIPTACSGSSASCPPLPILNLPAYDNFTAATMEWTDFNLVSFNDIIGNTGSVEGRIAAKRDISFGSGFSVADKINPVFDPIRAYSLVSGRNTNWLSGALYPNTLFQDADPFHEDGFVGGIANVETSLSNQMSGNACGAPGCLDGDFNTVQTYLANTIQPYLSSLPQNVAATAEFSGLFITCNNHQDELYVLNTNAATLASVTWYSLRGCNPVAGWVVNIQNEASEVVFTGDHLPSVAERTVYNILGSGRTVRVQTQVNGNIIAPLNNLVQTGGFISGRSYVANANGVSSIVVPRCGVVRAVTVIDFLVNAAPVGSNQVVLASGGNIIVGDVIVIGSQSRIVVDKQINADGTTTITLDAPLSAAASVNAKVSVQFDPNNVIVRDDGIRPAAVAASASLFSYSVAVIFAALYLLL